jgi:hypothetical protein
MGCGGFLKTTYMDLLRFGLTEGMFKGMNIIPHTIDGNIYDSSSALRALDTWSGHRQENEDDAVMRYIIYMYDEGTPLMKAFADMDKRKHVAFDLSNLTDKATRTQILSDKSFEVRKMAFEYLRSQKNMLWNLIISNEAMFYDAMKNMMDTTTADKDKDLMAALKLKDDMAIKMDKAHDRLRKYLKEFYNSDEKMVDNHNAVSRRMTSENIAKRMRE